MANSSQIMLSNQQARNLVLHLQGLSDPPNAKLAPNQLLDLITRMGFVQVDSIQWVERAHHMILFARNQTYRPKHLKNLAERNRALFEHWTHDSSFIPMAFYPWWQHKFERSREALKKKFSRWQGDGFLDHVEQLYSHIEKHGKLRSRDLEKPEGSRPKEMWQWDDKKASLEFLWRTGRLAISARESGFQKVYDLVERVVPGEHFCADLKSSTQYGHEAFVDWACRSALQRLGFGTAKDIAHFWELLTLQEVKQWCEDQRDDELACIDVECVDGSTRQNLFALPQTLALIDGLPEPPNRIRVLSPFDPVIRDRNRLEWLFGFDYRIEIYVPEAKRKYGYYVFPLLQDNRLIGRIDMKADRKTGELQVRCFWLEKGVRWSTAKANLLQAELVRLCRMIGVDRVTWPGSEPGREPANHP